MEITKKFVSYILVFLMVFSSFTVLPSEFWGLGDVSAVDLTAEEPENVETNKDEIAVEKPNSVKTSKNEIAVAESNSGETYKENDFIYSIINDVEVQIVGYNGLSKDIVIPDVTTGSECPELANKKVTIIGNKAFYSKKLTTVICGKNIKTIGTEAFYKNTALTSIDLSKCTELTLISRCAFDKCTELKALEVGGKLKEIGQSAFNNCKRLKTVNITSGNNTIISSNAFYDCDRLESVTLSNSVTYIGTYAFFSCNKLKNLTLGNSLKDICWNAFEECTSLTEVNIPDSVKEIEQYTFQNCTNLKTVTMGSGCENLSTLAFLGCPNLENIIISEDNPYFCSDNGIIFNKDKTLIKIFPKYYRGEYTIPNTVTSIGGYSFYGCEQLTNVKFHKGIKNINAYAFYSTKSLESVDLSECSELTRLSENAFRDSNIKYIKLPNKLKNITMGTLAYCTNLEDIALPYSVLYIGDSAFAYCESFKNLVLDNKIISIGSYAYSSCSGLENVTIGNNIETIGKSAFAGCTNLKNLTIGNRIDIINEKTFENCSSLEKVVIGDSVKTIDLYAFRNCSSLKEVTISDSVESIRFHAFANCPQLTNLKICNAIPRIDSVSFYKTPLENVMLLNENLSSVQATDVLKKTTVYCYKNSNTHKTLVSNGLKKIGFFSKITPTDITVNGDSIKNFNIQTKAYTVYLDDITNIEIAPTLEQIYANYKVTAQNNVYTIDIFNEKDLIVDTYKITVEKKAPEPQYTVIGDVTLTLDKINATKVGGSIALPAGTYKLKIAKGATQFGYNKTVTDYCNGLTLSEKFTSYITLNATGGTYKFQFDTISDKLIIKHDENLPNEYLIGDLDTILKPMGNRPLSIGTQQLQAGTYKFKLSIGGKEYGYNKIVDDASTGSLSMNSKYTAQVTLNATGGVYTFVLNTETNKLIIRHTPTDKEDTTDVHISGTFNLVLNDKSATGEELTTATGTTTLTNGCYTFKVYNYGTVYTASTVINDKATKNLSNKYTTPITLNATGGTYKFTFNKTTGALVVLLLT